MRTIVFAIFIFSSLSSGAQVDRLLKTKPDSLHYKNLFFRIYPVVMNHGEKIDRGEADRLFKKSPEAFVFYNKFKNKYKVGVYSLAGFFVFTAVSVLGFTNNNKTLAATGLTLSLASFINSIVFFSSGEASLKRAIGLYNQHPNY